MASKQWYFRSLPPDVNIARNLLFERDLSLLALNDERGVALMNFDRDAGKDAKRRQHLNAAVVEGADIGDARRFTKAEPIERGNDGADLITGAATAVTFRNRMLMGTESWMAKQRADRFGNVPCEEVLKLAGVNLALFDRHPEDIDDESLCESVTADDILCRLAAERCQGDAPHTGSRNESGALAFNQQLFGDNGHRPAGDARLGISSLLFAGPDGFQNFDNLVRDSMMHCASAFP
jgi:hypothetical protein